MATTETIAVKVPARMKAALYELAEDRGITAPEALRAILAQHLGVSPDMPPHPGGPGRGNRAYLQRVK